MMDGESQLKVCECVLLCVYKSARVCEHHFLLTRNCATLFIRRREIWKLLPAHLRERLARNKHRGGGVGLSGAFAKYASLAAERESTWNASGSRAAAGKWPRHADSSSRPT